MAMSKPVVFLAVIFLAWCVTGRYPGSTVRISPEKFIGTNPTAELTTSGFPATSPESGLVLEANASEAQMTDVERANP